MMPGRTDTLCARRRRRPSKYPMESGKKQIALHSFNFFFFFSKSNERNLNKNRRVLCVALFAQFAASLKPSLLAADVSFSAFILSSSCSSVNYRAASQLRVEGTERIQRKC